MSEAKEILINMMDHTAEAQVTQQFVELSRVCSISQLMKVMHYAVRPIVQFNGTLRPKQRKKDNQGKERSTAGNSKMGELDTATKPPCRVTKIGG